MKEWKQKVSTPCILCKGNNSLCTNKEGELRHRCFNDSPVNYYKSGALIRGFEEPCQSFNLDHNVCESIVKFLEKTVMAEIYDQHGDRILERVEGWEDMTT